VLWDFLKILIIFEYFSLFSTDFDFFAHFFPFFPHFLEARKRKTCANFAIWTKGRKIATKAQRHKVH